MPIGEEDGPFQVDCRVAPLVEPGHAGPSSTFGLVLVALWPATEPQRCQLLEGYRRLCAATELCFDEGDVVLSSSHFCCSSNDKPPPPVYIYPFTALHVTVATLHAFFEPPPIASKERQRTLKQQWSRVVDRARQMDEWPHHEPLKLTVDHAQIGVQAGILLWKETTGGLEAVRRCLAQAAAQPDVAMELQRHGVSVETLTIPTAIVHSTFLRFYGPPATPAATVRRRFRNTVLPRLHDFFSNNATNGQPPPIIHCPEVRLVCESVPYMHQSVDETVTIFPLHGSLEEEHREVETRRTFTDESAAAVPKDQKEGQSFVVDPRVAHLVEPPSKNFAETFGLTLVTAWPALRSQLLEPYYRLCALTELCFDHESDTARRHSKGMAPVYMYPFSALHISVAVLHAFFKQGEVVPKERQEILEAAWLNVMKQAAALADWPRQPLQLQFDRAVFGDRAGILVWKETTGGLQAMRDCVQTVCSRPATVAALARVDIAVADSLAVPNIVHTTFLRFYAHPHTPAATVRERFAKQVAPQLPGIFSQPISVPDARLIRERTPYMHIPVEESTIQRFPFVFGSTHEVKDERGVRTAHTVWRDKK